MAAGGHFEKKIQNGSNVAYWSEMVRNAIESDFRSSKMAAGGHFMKTNSQLNSTLSCITFFVPA